MNKNTKNTAETNTITKVKVFKDHERWTNCEKWFMMPLSLLNSLFVNEYEIDGNGSESHPDIKTLRRMHPDCVLVY